MSVQSVINVGQFGLSGLTIEDYLVRGDWNPITSLYPDNFGVNSIWFVVLPVDTVYLVFDGREWRNGDVLSYTVGSSSYDHFQKPTPRTFTLSGDIEGSVEYDGGNVVNIPTTFLGSQITSGTFNKIGVNEKGLVIIGTLEETLSGLGIQGDQILDGNLILNTTGYLRIPGGTSNERPITPQNGDIRYNETTSSYEGYSNGFWGGIGGAMASGAIIETNQVITDDYTLTSGKNGLSVGPVILNDGVSITVPDGARWAIV